MEVQFKFSIINDEKFAVSSTIANKGKLKVVYEFNKASATENLYEISVTNEKLSNNPVDQLVYSRAISFIVP